MNIVAWGLGGIVLTSLLLYKGCMNSMIEHSSRYTVAFSSDHARERGKLVKKVRVDPGFIVVNGTPVPVEEAWIERACQVRYTLLFFESVKCYDEYKLIVRLRGSENIDPNSIHIATARDSFGTQSGGRGKPFVLFESLGKEYPHTLTANVLDSAKQVVGRLNFETL
jgi:hypothetical protein